MMMTVTRVGQAVQASGLHLFVPGCRLSSEFPFQPHHQDLKKQHMGLTMKTIFPDNCQSAVF